MPLHRVHLGGGGGGVTRDLVQASERVGPPLFLGQIPLVVERPEIQSSVGVANKPHPLPHHLNIFIF